MDKLNNIKRVKITHNIKISTKEKNYLMIIKSLKEAGLSEKDINYIINGLRDIDDMIKFNKHT